MRNTLWRAMLDSQFNSIYWRTVADKYSRLDFWVKIFLALSASGTVAAWGIWFEHQNVWKALSGLAAIVSIASPFLAFSKKAESAAAHAGTWAELRIRTADLWEAYESKGESKAIADEHAKQRKIFIDLEREDAKLKIPQHKRLAERCQREVLRAKGLKPAERGIQAVGAPVNSTLATPD